MRDTIESSQPSTRLLTSTGVGPIPSLILVPMEERGQPLPHGVPRSLLAAPASTHDHHSKTGFL